MIDTPIKLNFYQGPQSYKYREDENEKFLGDPQFYVKGFKHEKDRIKESIEKNKNLGFEPNERSLLQYNFRDRDATKELQPQMRFTSKTSLERIEAFLKENTMTQVENVEWKGNKQTKQIFDNFPENMSALQKRAFISQQIAKNLLPSLHKKTHFQASQDIFNGNPSSVYDAKTEKQGLKNVLSSPDLSIINQQDENMLKDNNPNQAVQNQKELRSILPKIKNPQQKVVSIQDFQPEDPDVNYAKTETQSNSKKRNKQDFFEGFNSRDSSKEVLKTCFVIKEKNKKTKSLLSGTGHTISTLEKSMSQVYKDIYPNSYKYRTIFHHDHNNV